MVARVAAEGEVGGVVEGGGCGNRQEEEEEEDEQEGALYYIPINELHCTLKRMMMERDKNTCFTVENRPVT